MANSYDETTDYHYEDSVQLGHAEVPAKAHHDVGHTNLFEPELHLIVLTWVTFFLLLAVLRKYAWAPILKSLDDREARLQEAHDRSIRIGEEYAALAENRRKRLEETEDEARTIIGDARQAAANAGRVIESKAREDAQIILENTEREIRSAKERATHDLRRDSADTAVRIAEAILRDGLDEKKNRRLVEQMLTDLEEERT